MANIKAGVTREVTPSDDSANDDEFDMLMVTVAGSVSIQLKGGTSTIASLPAGVFFPFTNAVRVNNTGTTATGILVF